MENCLVTKLKGVVDNNNLKELGVLSFKVTSNANGAVQLQLNTAENFTYVYDSNGNLVQSVEGGLSGLVCNIPASTTYTIKVKGKYKFGRTFFSGVANLERIELDADELKYSERINNNEEVNIFYTNGVVGKVASVLQLVNNHLMLNGSMLTGTAAEIAAAKPDTVEMQVYGCSGITGNASELAPCKNLTNLVIRGSGITYSTGLKALFDGMWANGRTSGSMRIQLDPLNITNDAGITNYNSTITFTNDENVKWTVS